MGVGWYVESETFRTRRCNAKYFAASFKDSASFRSFDILRQEMNFSYENFPD